ncbi:MAG: BlaI/MecI/CopY family transcriptional regulator [Fuerstiella sp.]
MNQVSPTELELQILKVLWEDAPLTARQIRETLEQRGRVLAYTSVITTVQRMVDKGQLSQLAPTSGKAFRFQPLVSGSQVTGGMLGEFVDRVFDGSAEAVMLSLFDAKDLDEDTVKRLRRVFNKKLREMNHD